jgi:uncharacterized membrane protein required for colicin V production
MIGGNWIDIIIIFFLATQFIFGFYQGFIFLLLDLLSLVFAFILSIFSYQITASILESYFSVSIAYANILGFFINFFILKYSSLFLFDFLRKKSLKKKINPSFSKIMGGITSVISGIIIIIIFLTIVVSLSLPISFKEKVLTSFFGKNLLSQDGKLGQKLNDIFDPLLIDIFSKNEPILIDPESTEKIDLNIQPQNLVIDEISELEMLKLINQERNKRNLKKLEVDPILKKTAYSHSLDMAKNGYFSHYNLENKGIKERVGELDKTKIIIGENLVVAYDVESAHKKLMNSPAHRQNILSSFYRKIGIGVVDMGNYGKIFTQDFSD